MAERPIDEAIFREALQRLGEYANPKRQEEQDYVIRFSKLLWEYMGFVQSCIKSGETPSTWEAFVARHKDRLL